MVADAHLSANDNPVFQHGTAGEPGLGGDYHVFADLDVVPDVHEVIYFRAPADARNVERSTINGGIGSDFNIILYFQPSNLREFFISAGGGIADIAEPVAPQNRSCMHDDTITQASPGIDGHVGSQIAVFSDLDVGPKVRLGADPAARSDGDPLLDDGISGYGYIPCESRRWVNDGRLVDSRLRSSRRAKEL